MLWLVKCLLHRVLRIAHLSGLGRCADLRRHSAVIGRRCLCRVIDACTLLMLRRLVG